MLEEPSVLQLHTGEERRSLQENEDASDDDVSPQLAGENVLAEGELLRHPPYRDASRDITDQPCYSGEDDEDELSIPNHPHAIDL